jgi:hypothetical protein
MSGAIFWSRLLFHSLEKSILIFQKVEELENSVFKKEVSTGRGNEINFTVA